MELSWSDIYSRFCESSTSTQVHKLWREYFKKLLEPTTVVTQMLNIWEAQEMEHEQKEEIINEEIKERIKKQRHK